MKNIQLDGGRTWYDCNVLGKEHLWVFSHTAEGNTYWKCGRAPSCSVFTRTLGLLGEAPEGFLR